MPVFTQLYLVVRSISKERDEEALLEVDGLKKYFPIRSGVFSMLRGFVKAVDGITFSLERGKTLAIVGESGSGKSTLARSITRLVDPTGGSVILLGNNIEHLSKKELRKFRVNFQMVFQDPISSLNPRQLAIDIVSEPIKTHFHLHGEELTKRVIDLMEKVGLDRSQLYRYPHELSGGQKQRLGLARALSVNPKLLVLDEPTSNLDVSVQSQILRLLISLQKQLDLTYIFITHDLAIVYHVSDLVMVVYAGKVVEKCDTKLLFTDAKHPYSRILLSLAQTESGALKEHIWGEPPNLRSLPSGCRFHPRCTYKVEQCEHDEPELVNIGKDHLVACHVFAPRDSQPGEVHGEN